MATKTQAIEWRVIDPPERKRTYHFPGGTALIIRLVKRVEVRPSGVHRIETQDGLHFFVSPSWQWIDLDIDDWTF